MVPLLEHLDDELLDVADVSDTSWTNRSCGVCIGFWWHRVYPTFAFAQVLLRLLPGVSWFLELRHVPRLQALSGRVALLT
jgi:hypothetical protein